MLKESRPKSTAYLLGFMGFRKRYIVRTIPREAGAVYDSILLSFSRCTSLPDRSLKILLTCSIARKFRSKMYRLGSGVTPSPKRWRGSQGRCFMLIDLEDWERRLPYSFNPSSSETCVLNVLLLLWLWASQRRSCTHARITFSLASCGSQSLSMRSGYATYEAGIRMRYLRQDRYNECRWAARTGSPFFFAFLVTLAPDVGNNVLERLVH